MPLGIIVLAAGRSKRFKSAIPKALHPMCGQLVLLHILAALKPLRATQIVVVVPPGGQVEAVLPAGMTAVVQTDPRGTGDATRIGLNALNKAADSVLVVPGDAPLLDTAVLRLLVKTRRKAQVSVLSAILPDPGSYGRIVRSDDGSVLGIVEAKDASPEQRRITEVNASVYVFDRTALAKQLPKLKRDNAQGEFYLPDVVQALAPHVHAVVGSPECMFGTNTRADHALAEAAMRRRILDYHMHTGVTIVDPAATYIDAGISIKPDTVIQPNTHLRGATKIGTGCEIGPNVLLSDTVVGDRVRIRFAEADGAKLMSDCDAGPFAYLRPGTIVKSRAHIGAFVEINRTTVGEGSKVPHLSYIGDAQIGQGANISAGVITCNYDGRSKHRTKIGNRTFIGTGSTLVAPVSVGDDAYTGAQSLVNRDVPKGATVYGVPARPKPRPKHLPLEDK